MRTDLTQYLYWSQRLVEDAAGEFRVDLSRRPVSISVPIPWIGAQLSIGRGRQEFFRADVERRLERKLPLGQQSPVAAPPAPAYLAADGRVEMGRFRAWPDETFTAYLYSRAPDGNGDPVDVCLFGSMHNYSGWVRAADESGSGWASSSAPAILALLESAGRVNLEADDPEDYEPIAVEALRIALDQGNWTFDEAHHDLPESRGYTLGRAEPARWCARIYLDVTLTKGRWRLEDLGNPRRILIGAPLWVRTSPTGLIPYTRARRAPAIEEAKERKREIEARNGSAPVRFVGTGAEEARTQQTLERDPTPVRRAHPRRRKHKR